MQIAYLECFAGISGDMFLAALIDAGVDPAVMMQAVDALHVGAVLQVEKVDRSGIYATKVNVLVNGKSAEGAAAPEHTHEHEHSHGHSHEHGHTHSHKHEHSHGRSLSVIRRMIQEATLADGVKATAIRAFELLGESEAKIHNVSVEKIHFHEVGAVDAIADIIAAAAGIHALGVDAWVCSPLNVGGGMVECAHGRFPVPAPATADLLKDVPTYSSGLQMELVTPTGAALVRALECSFSAQPAMQVKKIGYGAGSRNPKGFPNVLRLSVGEATTAASDVAASETVVVMETTVDDLNPQVIGYLTQKALQSGALDVTCTAVQMKKNRPGTLVTILCRPDHSQDLQQLLFAETSTLGLRVREERRIFLDRTFVTVQTEWGEVRVKVGLLHGSEVNAMPEYEDCRTIAETQGIPLKQVMQAVLLKYQTR
ncbi:MAG: nickel pincer cofactor biosynthesis protein LarC [Acidobacteriaceae bacterium]